MMIWMLLAGALVAWRFVLLRSRSINLPPGTVGWPLLREFIPFFFRLHGFLTKRREMYGDLFKTCLLGYPVIISTDPHVNSFILHNDGTLFVPQYPTSTMELSGKSNIMTGRGECHKIKRGGVMRVVGIPILKRRLLSEIQNVITSSLSGWGGRNVDVIHEAEEMIFSILANHLLSLKAGTEFDRMKEDFFVCRKGFFSLPFNIPGTSFYKSLRKKKELSNQIKNIIEARNINMLSNDIHVDLLSLMLKEAVENEDGELEFATFRIIDFLLELLIPSISVTPKAIALVMKRLSENPHTIKELREEHEAIKRTKGESEKFSWDDYKSMVYTKCVIKEALRLGDGLFNGMLLRKTTETVQIRGYTIPKGWTCIIFDEFSNLDSKYYTDPLAFNPRRWLHLDMDRTPYISFGAGPRHCPGYEFAMVVMSSFLHHLVTNFKWDYILSDAKSRWFDSPFTSRINWTFQVEDSIEVADLEK